MRFALLALPLLGVLLAAGPARGIDPALFEIKFENLPLDGYQDAFDLERDRHAFDDVRRPYYPGHAATENAFFCFYNGAVKEAARIANIALANQPDDLLACTIRGNVQRKHGRYARALTDYSHALMLDPNYYTASREMAWLLATSPDEAIRDADEALRLATQACELTNWRSPFELEAFAAANAEIGDFETAVKWQSEAIRLLYFDEWFQRKKDAYARLYLYLADQTYREVNLPRSESPGWTPPKAMRKR